MSFLEKTRNWYGRFEHPISSFSLVAGFVFDALTLKRVDMFWENIWILVHLVIVGLFILLINLQDSEKGDEYNPEKKHFWYVNILQFFFGGLLSTYLVFYFRSADIFVTWHFILVLLLAFILNQFFKSQYVRFNFQISLFFLSIYSFAIFLIPVILHKIGTKIFLLSGLISIIFIAIFLLILFFTKKKNFIKNKKTILISIVGISFLINFLYFTNLIPPIPLSLKDGGIYNFVQKNHEGNYDVYGEDYSWKEYFKLYKDFKRVPGSPIYAYSAIFSPRNLNLKIVHEWQYYDDGKKEWLTKSVVNLPVVGGRDGGFRTYSMRSNLEYGKWRVDVKTELGQTIGRLRFNIVYADAEPTIIKEIKK
ncbi:MAG TPA: DUF2914 domain-containing protein [Candidatus Paceibacterota bacterium]|nr:DUF2914 domain-containing protein [Candidatus Paceibacterota bacterium]HPT18399.1 DUF2914 domain-containing protein [Candidatus Paceibacterota bacterium]